MDISLVSQSAALGVALAMDAFSVSLANGLNEPCMKKGKMLAVAGMFSFFQFAMPMIGWTCVSTLARMSGVFEKAVPYIAFVLLCFIGGKMLYDSIKCNDSECGRCTVCFSALVLQGVATSIDALSAGFTISQYDFIQALSSCLVIAAVTFAICICGVLIGKKFGTKLAGKAGILGGVILIAIGFKIFVSGVLS